MQEIFRRFCFAALKLGVLHTHSSCRLAFYLTFSAAASTAVSLFLVFLPDSRPVVALIRQVKRRRALQACNPPRDNLVDGAPMALAPWVYKPREPFLLPSDAARHASKTHQRPTP